jgi:hypothetical protein
MFGNLSPQDSATLAVELWLLLELSSYQSQEHEKLCNQIQNLLNQEDTQDIALPLAFQYDLKVNLLACDISKIKIEFEKYYYKQIRKSPHERQVKLQNMISFQSKEKQLELSLFMVTLWRWTDARLPVLRQSLVKTLFSEEEVSILGNSVGLTIFSYLCGQPLKPNDLKTLNKIIDGVKNIQSQYLRAIWVYQTCEVKKL